MNPERLLIPIIRKVKMATVYHFLPWISAPGTLQSSLSTYNRTSHLDERKKMMQTWADYLDNLKSGAKVIQISERSAG